MMTGRFREAIAAERDTLITRIDLAWSLGPRHVLRRAATDRRHRHSLPSRIRRVEHSLWRDAADAVGAELTEVVPSLFEFRRGAGSTRVWSQSTPLSDQVSRTIANDKQLAYELLSAHGVPVPEHVLVERPEQAERFLADAAPCVVKPARGRGGEAIAGEVRNPRQLRRALRAARRIHPEAIVERQIRGDSYRLLLLDGELLDAIRRSPPTVIGDSSTTVEDLVFAEYDRRVDANDAAGLKHLVVDLDCLFTLEQAGLTPKSVPAKGERVRVKTATNYNGPAESHSVPDEIGEPLLTEARRAADALGVRLAGVDVVTSDPARALSDAGGVVLEVNPVPGLTHHYNVSNPERARAVAVPILETLLRESEQRARLVAIADAASGS
jgi:cyanophycin synthetase